MIHRLPTNCRRKLFHLCARLETDATMNEVTPLNRAEFCESVVFLHSQIILTMLMQDSHTADELPTKFISFVCEAGHRRNHKWSNSAESRRSVWKCSFFYTVKVVKVVLTMVKKNSQTADELPTTIISFVGEAEHRRNHKWSNSSESRRIVQQCSFLTQSKYSDYAHEWFTDYRRIADENYFICGRGWTQTQP